MNERLWAEFIWFDMFVLVYNWISFYWRFEILIWFFYFATNWLNNLSRTHRYSRRWEVVLVGQNIWDLLSRYYIIPAKCCTRFLRATKTFTGWSPQAGKAKLNTSKWLSSTRSVNLIIIPSQSRHTFRTHFQTRTGNLCLQFLFISSKKLTWPERWI